MHMKTAQGLMIYGVFLILAGVAGFLSNPEKAKTALMSGGTFGSLAIVLGWLGTRRISWSLTAARVCTFFLSGVFTWRAIATWNKVLDGAPEKTFAAGLISLMLAASVLMFTLLLRDKRQ